MDIMTMAEYVRLREIPKSTASRHAKALGLRKTAGVYLLTPRDVKRLDASIGEKKPESQ